MRYLRMIAIAVGLAWPHLLTPWRSPVLRWRLETYGVLDARGRLLHAEDITPRRFLAFACRHWRDLARFLRWAALL